ncbi:hypothetical protein ACFLVK_01545 [Chloroflexota bacterium]
MNKMGIGVVLALVLSLVMVLGSVSAVEAGPPSERLIIERDATYPTGSNPVKLSGSASWSKFNIYAVSVKWQIQVGSYPNAQWVDIEEDGRDYGVRTPQGSLTLDKHYDVETTTQFRFTCQVYDRKGNPISDRKGGYKSWQISVDPPPSSP